MNAFNEEIGFLIEDVADLEADLVKYVAEGDKKAAKDAKALIKMTKDDIAIMVAMKETA